jgi:hypothetical protein
MPFPVLLYNNARMEPWSDHNWLLYAFVFSLFPTPPPPRPQSCSVPHICIRSSCACHVKCFEKIPHYRMHDVTVSTAVTSFEFLVSEIFIGNTPPKTYTCQYLVRSINREFIQYAIFSSLIMEAIPLIQSNTVQVYSNSVSYLHMYGACFSLYLSHPHAFSTKSIQRKIQ